ncbi:hypothetical protein BTVI_120899 [Pitangus sulphuratus]|nr:hypothetical protein BTVI_120899 [Pitangus sulphuratus]
MASPPLSAAGGSGAEHSSGSEAAPPGRDLPALFEQAAERLPALLPAASKEQLLYLYARYKQVKLGTCNTPKPSFFDFEGKQKWEAWKALGDTSPHQAMQEYIAAVKKLDPSWNPQILAAVLLLFSNKNVDKESTEKLVFMKQLHEAGSRKEQCCDRRSNSTSNENFPGAHKSILCLHSQICWRREMSVALVKLPVGTLATVVLSGPVSLQKVEDEYVNRQAGSP